MPAPCSGSFLFSFLSCIFVYPGPFGKLTFIDGPFAPCSIFPSGPFLRTISIITVFLENQHSFEFPSFSFIGKHPGP